MQFIVELYFSNFLKPLHVMLKLSTCIIANGVSLMKCSISSLNFSNFCDLWCTSSSLKFSKDISLNGFQFCEWSLHKCDESKDFQASSLFPIHSRTCSSVNFSGHFLSSPISSSTTFQYFRSNFLSVQISKQYKAMFQTLHNQFLLEFNV